MTGTQPMVAAPATRTTIHGLNDGAISNQNGWGMTTPETQCDTQDQLANFPG